MPGAKREPNYTIGTKRDRRIQQRADELISADPDARPSVGWVRRLIRQARKEIDEEIGHG